MKRIDMKGQRHGRLTVVDYADTFNGHIRWKCRCDCGNETIVCAGDLRSGHTKTCGHCEKYSYVDADTMRCDLPNGDYFLIDEADYPKVSKHKWSIENTGYVHTTMHGKHTRMHVFLLGQTDMVIDHINGNRNDNRRCNLRLCSTKENIRNQRIGSRNKIGYKGVCFDKRKKKYLASITADYKKHFLGYFTNPKEAAEAYDAAALKYFGEFAKLNFESGRG